MEEYRYPANIGNEEYKNRKMLITVKSLGADKNANDAFNTALTSLKKAVDYIEAPAKTAQDMEKNTKSNSKSRFDKEKATIVLPLPNSFTDSQSHEWSNETSIIGEVGRTLMGKTAQGGVESLKKGGKKVGVVGGILDTLGVGAISADKAIATAAAASGTRKPIIDPGYFQNYSGSTPRTFTMDWDFVPKNPEEANDIIAIIMKFKQFSSPTRMSGGVSLFAPYYFNIKLNSDLLTSMIKLDRLVIANMNIDYGADGAMQQTADGMPKYIKLSLTFNEVDMHVAEDYYTIPMVGN